MAITINWDGNSEGLQSALFFGYIVNNRFFTLEELEGAYCTGSVLGEVNANRVDMPLTWEEETLDNVEVFEGITLSGKMITSNQVYVSEADSDYFLVRAYSLDLIMTTTENGVTTTEVIKGLSLERKNDGYISSITLPNAEEIKLPLAEITYNGETIAQLNAGDKATIPCSKYKMSKDLIFKINEVAGGGSGECSGEHIIPVEALPAVGEEGAIYELTQKFSDVVVYIKDYAMKIVLGDENELYCYTVPTKPTENIQVTDMSGNSTPIHCYYVEDENDLFVYCDNDGDGTTEWVSFAELGFGTFQGTISNADEATADGYYAIGGGVVYYQCVNGTFEKMMYKKDEYIPTTEEKIVIPATYTQTIEPSEADYLSKVFVNPIPSTYVYTSGTKTVTANGTHNVNSYKYVEVDVPQPSGSVELTENGTHDVTDYESAVVNVDTLQINGIIEQYKVKGGTTVNAGDFVEFINMYCGSGIVTDGAVEIVACKLDDSRVLCAYRERSGESGTFVARILTIKDTKIEVGTQTDVFSEKYTVDSYDKYLTALTENKVLLTYKSFTGGKALAVVLTISGTTITVGEPLIYCSDSCSNVFEAVCLSEDTAIITYCYSKHLKAVVLTISGTTITAGEAITIKDTESYWVADVAKLSSTKAIVAYRDNTYSDGDLAAMCELVVLTISGTTITAGETVELANKVKSICITTLTESKALLSYTTGDSYHYGLAVVLTIDGTTITMGTAEQFASTGTQVPVVERLNESKVIAVYNHWITTTSAPTEAVVLTIDGTTITTGDAITFEELQSLDFYPSVIFGNFVFLIYKTSSSYSILYTSLIIDGTTITVADGDTMGIVCPATSRANNVGVAKTGGAGGETVDVYCVNNQITFTIYDGGTSFAAVTCTAKEGMTWAEWCKSDYNTNSGLSSTLAVDTNNHIQGGAYNIYDVDGYVLATDVIVPNGKYDLTSK